MTGRPADVIPFWSENANYPAGTDPWSGLPTAVPPAVALRNGGLIPRDQWPAQYENSWKRSMARYMDYLADIGFMNWSRPLEHDSDVAPGTFLFTSLGLGGIQNYWSNYHQAWFVHGQNANGIFYVGDACALDKFSTGAAVKYHFGAVDEATGISVQFNGDAGAAINYRQTAADLNSGTNNTLPGVSGGGAFAYHSHYIPFDDTPTGGRIFIFGSKNSTEFTVWESDDSGSTWGGIHQIDAVNLPGSVRSAHRAGEIVVVTKNDVTASTPRLWYSTDVGGVWTQKVGAFATTDTILGIYYSAEEDTYIIGVQKAGGDHGFYLCSGSITNAFTYQSVTASLPAGSSLKCFGVFGSAILFCASQSANRRRWYLSWNLGAKFRSVGRPTLSNYAVELAVSPQGQFFTHSALDVSQTLQVSGIGSVARGE